MPSWPFPQDWPSLGPPCHLQDSAQGRLGDRTLVGTGSMRENRNRAQANFSTPFLASVTKTRQNTRQAPRWLPTEPSGRVQDRTVGDVGIIRTQPLLKCQQEKDALDAKCLVPHPNGVPCGQGSDVCPSSPSSSQFQGTRIRDWKEMCRERQSIVFLSIRCKN